MSEYLEYSSLAQIVKAKLEGANITARSLDEDGFAFYENGRYIGGDCLEDIALEALELLGFKVEL